MPSSTGLIPPALRPVELAALRYRRWTGLVVQSGPFRGMRYVEPGSREPGSFRSWPACRRNSSVPHATGRRAGPTSLWMSAPPKVTMRSAPPSQAGAIASSLRDRSWARATLAELMARNGVPAQRLEIRGACTTDELPAVLAPYRRPAMIMDVEGHEALLLDPLRVPSLARCRLLVEHHDFVLPGLSSEIRRRWIRRMRSPRSRRSPHRRRPCLQRPVIRMLPAGIRRHVLNEHRPFSQHGWLWMEPRDPGLPDRT